MARTSMSHLWQMLLAYFFGLTTCFILLQLFICKDKLGVYNNLKSRIYISNQFYNRWGLLNEGESDEHFEKFDECMEMYRKYHIKWGIKDNDKEPDVMDNQKPTMKSRNRNLFINCGGTFPWSVELFLDTYPDSADFHIYTFIRDNGYSIMYKNFPNHTIYPAEASTKNGTESMNLKCFGCGYPQTEQIVKLDIIHWIQTNTNKNDMVILRLESDEEKEIVHELIKQKLFDNIDKYYTTSADENFPLSLQEELRNHSFATSVHTWYVNNQTYSDFLSLNTKSIPIKGSLIDRCLDKEATEKFALFLYSNASTMNILNVINLLHQFSPKDVLPVTMFLPYQFYKANWSNIHWLFTTFDMGLYYSPINQSPDSDSQSRRREMSLRNTAIAVQSILKAHGTYMQSIMYHPDTDSNTVQEAMEEYNYNFYAHGLDISHLTDTVLEGGTITMEMTGWEEGRYLMINVDTPLSEYLVLYMVKSFAPWLLQAFQCSIPKPGF